MSGECSFARESRSQDALGLSRIDVAYMHVDFHLLLNMQHGNEIDFQTLKRRLFIDVETTSISRR